METSAIHYKSTFSSDFFLHIRFLSQIIFVFISFSKCTGWPRFTLMRLGRLLQQILNLSKSAWLDWDVLNNVLFFLSLNKYTCISMYISTFIQFNKCLNFGPKIWPNCLLSIVEIVFYWHCTFIFPSFTICLVYLSCQRNL